jgi:predicted ATPase
MPISPMALRNDGVVSALRTWLTRCGRSFSTAPNRVGAPHAYHRLCIGLQWADAATLRMLQILLENPAFHHLLVIGAYRDNEVGSDHPLIQTLSRIESAGVACERILLPSLEPEHLNALIADSLRCPPQQAAPLADLIRLQTGGNPFFVIQFITAIHSDGLLAYDAERGAWSYDLQGIRRLGITDNVVDLLLRKIRRLAEATQKALELCACIGQRFDLQTLSVAGEVSPEQAAAELRAALREGLILPLSEASTRLAAAAGSSAGEDPKATAYRFLHDRVQQAACALIPA